MHTTSSASASTLFICDSLYSRSSITTLISPVHRPSFLSSPSQSSGPSTSYISSAVTRSAGRVVQRSLRRHLRVNHHVHPSEIVKLSFLFDITLPLRSNDPHTPVCDPSYHKALINRALRTGQLHRNPNLQTRSPAPPSRPFSVLDPSLHRPPSSAH